MTSSREPSATEDAETGAPDEPREGDLRSARFTLEQVRSLSAEDAVQHRFDVRNLWVLRRFLWFFLVAELVSLIAVLAEDDPGRARKLVAAASSLVVVAVLLGGTWPLVSDRQLPRLGPLARWLRTRIRGTVLAYLVLQYVLVAVFSLRAPDDQGWTYLLPWALALFRFRGLEHLVVYGTMLGASFVWMVVLPAVDVLEELAWEAFVATAVNVGVGFAIALFFTARYRREVTREWDETREHFRDRIRMQEELEFARQVQLDMLPREGPGLDWLEVAAHSRPAKEVGGDYYGFFPVGDHRLAIVVADVAGHGLASGLVLSGLRSGLALLRDELTEPHRVMEKLHRMLRETSGGRLFVTLACVVLDWGRRRATITSAGHPPVLFSDRSEDTVEAVDLASFPLGANLADEYPVREIEIEEGDGFLIYTDGLYETTNPKGEPFGLERVESCFAEGRSEAPRAVVDSLRERLRDFRNESPLEDDVTLLVVQVGDLGGNTPSS